MRGYFSNLKWLFTGFLAVLLLMTGGAGLARASSPYLQLSTNDLSNFQIMVSGAAPYRMVDFHTRQSDTQMWTTYSNIGSTDSSGYFSRTIMLNSFNPSLTRESYVVIDGQQSNIVNTNSSSQNTSYNSITFSQNNINLGVGQSITVSIYGNGGSYYVSQNSNQSVALPSISGNSLTIYGSNSGNSTITVCANYVYAYSGNNCGTLYVTVSGSSTGANIWFSPSNPMLYVGQSLAVSINSNSSTYMYPSYNSIYYISSNSNPAVASASISGTVVNLYAYQNGSTSIVVNNSNLGWSGTLYVIVQGNNNGGGYGGGMITFSNSNPTVVVGQSINITAYPPSSNYTYNNSYTGGLYISNSNNSIVQASINGQTINFYGVSYGSSSVTVCQNNSSACGSVYVSVTGMNYGTGSSTRNGQLMSQNGTVYITYKNTISGFTNESAFLGLGFSFSNVTDVGYSNLVKSSYLISTANSFHPWGSWIKSGQTVYFVHETGLIPIPSYDIFLNNGGQDRLVVPSNAYDWQRPQLSQMTYNDYRLQ